MYVFSKENKSWTCPDSSLVTIARIQASGEEKERIFNEITAKRFLETVGFVIEHVNDPEPLTEVPKVANWYDRTHRDLYDRLFYHDIGRELTEEENEFCKTMYHFEEYACGLDG